MSLRSMPKRLGLVGRATLGYWLDAKLMPNVLNQAKQDEGLSCLILAIFQGAVLMGVLK